MPLLRSSTCVGFGARVGTLQVVDVAAHKLEVLQAILGALRAAEGKHCCAAVNPRHMYLPRERNILIYAAFCVTIPGQDDSTVGVNQQLEGKVLHAFGTSIRTNPHHCNRCLYYQFITGLEEFRGGM